jgi:hypothetical protein
MTTTTQPKPRVRRTEFTRQNGQRVLHIDVYDSHNVIRGQITQEIDRPAFLLGTLRTQLEHQAVAKALANPLFA